MRKRSFGESPHPDKMYGAGRITRGLKALILGPKELRSRVIQEIVRILSLRCGGHLLGDQYKLWSKDKDFISEFKGLSPHNHFSMERKFTLKEFTKSVSDLPGAAAEAGCYVGVSAWFMANELDGCDFHLFDSFEGLSEPGVEDQSPEGVSQWERGHFSGSEIAIRKNLSEFKGIQFHKGWIPERFPDVASEKFKIVHIDVDLYEPTFESIRFFYPRMTIGGIMVFDDYGFENCLGAYRAVNEFFEDKSERIIHLPTGQGVVIKK